jgi:hypothetical protein
MPGPIIQLYTWLVFGTLLFLAWDDVMPGMINTLSDALTVANVNDIPIRRTYLIALAIYTLILLWFDIMFLLILMFVGCIMVIMASTYAVPTFLGPLLRWLFNPVSIFHCITTDHVPFHAAVFVCVTAAAMVSIMLYITDDDLPSDAVNLKMRRIMYSSASIMVIVYGVYAMYGFFTSCLD